MRKVFVEPVVLPEPRYRDGLGIRYVRTEGTDDRVEVLRPLWDVGSMQNAIRQRVKRLASFRQARFVPVRAAEVPRDDVSTIEVVSDYVSGHRLSQYLEASQDGTVSIDLSTAIYVVRELLGALALLHESRGVTHGAVGPERILITPKGRVVVADYVLGPAIERLEFTRPRLWREFRIPLPSGKGVPKLDDRADVIQVGLTALALLLGRPIETVEYPDRLDEFVAALGRASKPARRPVVPAVMIGWLKRALFKDPNGKFGNVSDARLALEEVIPQLDGATGGAAALKALAEAFGRFAAAMEARAAADAAQAAREAALAAQAASQAALEEQAAEAAAAAPLVNLVPAFDRTAEMTAGSADFPDAAASETAEAQGAESDPPVGWRVPEAPPVEETLPTSPLIQIDEPSGPPAEEEFVEELLDLAAIAESDGGAGAEADVYVLTADAAEAPLEQIEANDPPSAAENRAPVGELLVDPRDLDATRDPIEAFEPVAGVPEVAAVPPPAEPGPVADAWQLEKTPDAIVDAALAALDAEPGPAPVPRAEAVPEWRLLADPIGAAAPTIDVEVPTETLDDLVAEFAATMVAGEPFGAGHPTPVPSEARLAATSDLPAREQTPTAEAHHAPSVGEAPEFGTTDTAAPCEEPPAAGMVEAPHAMMAPPAAMVAAPVPGIEAPAEFSEPAPELDAGEAARAPEASSVLEEILGLQEAQAAAQAASTSRPEPPATEPDVAAWSFVEELVHRDARFASRAPAEPDLQPEPAEAVAPPAPMPQMAAAASETAEVTEWQAVGEVPAVETEPEPPAVEEIAPALPADWFIEVGQRSSSPSPAHSARFERDEPPFVAATPPPPPAVAPAPALAESLEESAPSMAPAPRPPAPRELDEETTGPVFPRVAPSVRRVRAEARRRRVARIGNGVVAALQAIAGIFVSGAAAIASATTAIAMGIVRVVAAAGRGVGLAGAAVLSAAAALVSALLRGIGGASRAAVSGAVLLGRAATAGAAAVLGAAGHGILGAARATGRLANAGARASALVLRVGAAGAGRALRALGTAGIRSAAALAWAAGAIARAAGGAVSVVTRGLASGLGAFGRGSVHAVAAIARVAGLALSAAGRGAALSGRGIGRGAVAAPRKLYFVASDVADRLPRLVFRPWYLAAALVVIVAVAGVPYAKAWLFTAKPVVGTIRVESRHPDALVTIDGVAQGRAPVTASVPVGRHRIEVATSGQTLAHEVEVTEGRETVVKAVGADVKGTGSIRVTTDPAGVEVLVDGVLHGTSPLTVENLAEGPHTLLVRDGTGSVKQTVRVKPDEAVDATVQIRPGWLAVFAPVRLDILESGRSIGSTERGRILASPGPHTIEVVSQAIGFRETRQVDVKPGGVAALTIQLPPVTIEVVAPMEAEILVDGQSVGQAPLGPVQVAVGTREILMRHPALGERRQVVSVTYKAPVRVVFE